MRQYAAAAHACRLPEHQRSAFAHFALRVPADALAGFLRDQAGCKGPPLACPGWFYRR